jgi:hypothetical protein
MLRTFFVIILTLIFTPSLLATPFWGEKESKPVDTVPFMLNPGQFIWKGDAVPYGPIVVV